jgi:arylsulfatase A-like enzyme
MARFFERRAGPSYLLSPSASNTRIPSLLPFASSSLRTFSLRALCRQFREMAHQPNILWILTTQWRASATGYRGDCNVRTPWLDGLASESTDYREAVTPHPSGPQARAALFTGKLCPENGVADYWDPLPTQTRTIAHALESRGYSTAFFGKWHLADRSRSAPFVGEEHAKMIVPFQHRGGFAFWEGFESGFLLNDPWLHGSRLSEPRRFKGYQADVLVQRAAEWMKTKHSRPFFCVLSLETPHPPYHAPTPHVRAQNPCEIELRPNVPSGDLVEQRARDELSGYYAHIEATDCSIGKLISELDATDTVIAFTSVHGDMHGSHGLFRKAWPYEESVRVPFLVRNSRIQGNGSEDASPISLVDLPHMSVAWAEGREWRCKRDNALISVPVSVNIPLQCDRAWYGFRTPKHKLILNADGSPWLYFDLERDPFEMENLVNEPTRSAEIERHRQLL